MVYLAEDTRKDHKIMALKTMKPQGGAEATESFRAEFLNIRGVVHPNIPEVFDFGILPETETQLYFTCEFVAGNSLDHLAATWTPQQLQVVLVSLCRALAFLHSRGLLHRDIKPQNVLGRLGSNGQLDTLKLVDFGLSAKREESAEFAGTMDYMAPELIGGESASMVSDIYAIGMLIYRLATGHLPFEGTDPIAVTRQRCIAEAPPALRFSPDLPVGLSDVIGTLIRIRPEDRPSSARHVIALLNEHQGTEYPYETVETRSAYIRSAVTVTHREVRETMRQMRLRRAAGEPVKPVLVLGPRGLGRRRLLGAFAAELGVDGCAVRLAETERDLEQGAADVLIVPDVSRLDAEKLRIAVETARSRDAWILLGGAGVPPELPAMFPSLDRLTLHPLEAPEVAEFLTAMFPENNFQGTFAEQLHSRTMGFTAAIERALQHLLDTEQLRIGLSGWELMPGRWDVPIHPAVPEHVQAVGEHLSGGARRLAEVVACSSSALPRAVLLEMYGDLVDPSASLDTAIAELNRVGWLVKTEDSYRLRHSAAAELVENSQDPEEHRRFHRLLARAWAGELLRDHPLQDRELLYHHIHSADWDIAPDYTAAQLRSVLDEGNAVWVRKLIETGVLLDPPPRLGDVLLDALVVVEFIEGNIEASAERLGNVLQHGEIEVAEENLERMARYAGLEEKLGRADRAQIILERCLQVLPAGHDSRAGMVFGPLAWILFKQGDAEKARELAEEGLIRIPPHAADFGQALLLNTVATLAFYRGDLDA
ncbi:serine/threonine protein kinase, partial [bacterium]|nr:serine/threonine protein kinase [bacterium]